MNDEIIELKLNEHEEKINKNTEHISNLKTENATQNVLLKNLQNSIEKLTSTLDKYNQNLVNNLKSNNAKSNSDWKWIVGVILMPVIFFLLSKLF